MTHREKNYFKTPLQVEIYQNESTSLYARGVLGTMGQSWSQSAWIPNPPLTDKNIPNQSGKVDIRHLQYRCYIYSVPCAYIYYRYS